MRTMRVSLVVAAALCAVVYVPTTKAEAAFVEAVAEGGQVKDDLFAGTEKFAQGATEVTDVNLDKDMLSMVGGKYKDKGKGSELAGKLDFVVVHSYTYDKPGMYRMEDVEVFRKKLKDGNWNCFVHVKEKNEATDVCMRKAGDDINEMVVMTAELKELTFIHVRGHGISMDDLSRFGYNGGYGTRRLGIAPEPPTPPAPPAARSARPPAAPAPPVPPQ